MSKRQNGFSIFELVMILVVAGVIAAAGWMVYKNHKSTVSYGKTTAATGSNTTAKASDVSSVPAVNTASDLDNALNVLNQNDPNSANSSDSSQLNSQSNF